MNTISVGGLCKRYPIKKKREGFFKKLFSFAHETLTALDHISFELKEGELVGYIGPNGSGKSTTVKILSGVLVPSEGTVKVLGRTPWENRIETVKNIGVVFGQRTQLWWDLPVIESFELLKKIYRIEKTTYQNNLSMLTEILELAPFFQVPVRNLSLGQRMRCDLAASLLHSPKILFLDEPTIGLDAVSKLAARDFIAKLNQEQKVTILLTTHDMDDIEALCDRVLVLHEGKIVFDGSLSELRRKISPHRCLVVDLSNPQDFLKKPFSHISFIKQEGHRVFLHFDPTLISTKDLIQKITSEHAITDLYVENPPIEEIIAKFYKSTNL